MWIQKTTDKKTAVFAEKKMQSQEERLDGDHYATVLRHQMNRKIIVPSSGLD